MKRVIRYAKDKVSYNGTLLKEDGKWSIDIRVIHKRPDNKPYIYFVRATMKDGVFVGKREFLDGKEIPFNWDPRIIKRGWMNKVAKIVLQEGSE